MINTCFQKFFCGIFFFFVVLFNGLFAQEDPKALWKRAVEFTCSTTFRAQGLIFNGVEENNIYWMGKNGKLRYEERNQLKDVALMPNSSGNYHYFHWIEEKSNHPLNASVMEIPYCNMEDYYAFYKMQIAPLLYNRAKYTARQENNRIFLTVRHPTDDESIINTPCMNFRVLSSNILKSHFDTWTEPLTKESFDINPELCRNAYCARITYIIDSTPECPFIYGYTTYDRNGKRKFSFQWKSVDFPKDLDDGLFTVPSQAKVVKLDRRSNYGKLNQTLWGNEKKRILSEASSKSQEQKQPVVKNDFLTFFSKHYILFIVIPVIFLVLIVLFKKRQ